ncbi:hypothetical protein FQN53_007549 [Emmonsiellopsis sp. PD_33]|nr:hypothetical protein FQN53_007549 [Emmonsiellopsis sp. PD_33]
MVPSTGMAVSVLIANLSYGWDRHIWDLEAHKFTPGMKLATVCYILFAVASATTKLSLLSFYRRLITPVSHKNYRWVIIVLEVLVLVTCLAYSFSIPFLCRPIRAAWDYTPPLYKPAYEYHCIDRFEMTFPASVINTILDFLTMLVPMPIAWQLTLPMRQRLAVIGIFCLGAVVVVAASVKTKYLVSAMGKSYDEQWDAYPLWIMGIVELDVGIICASAPALRPLISRYMPNVFGSMNRPHSRPPAELSLNSVPVSSRSRYLSDAGTYKSISKLENARTTTTYVNAPTSEGHASIRSPRSIQSPMTIGTTEFIGVAMSTDAPITESEYDYVSHTPSPTFPDPYPYRKEHSRNTSSGSFLSFHDNDITVPSRSGSTNTRGRGGRDGLGNIDEHGVSTWRPMRAPIERRERQTGPEWEDRDPETGAERSWWRE